MLVQTAVVALLAAAPVFVNAAAVSGTSVTSAAAKVSSALHNSKVTKHAKNHPKSLKIDTKTHKPLSKLRKERLALTGGLNSPYSGGYSGGYGTPRSPYGYSARYSPTYASPSPYGYPYSPQPFAAPIVSPSYSYVRRDTILSPRSLAPLFNNKSSQRRAAIVNSYSHARRDTIPSPRSPSGELSPRSFFNSKGSQRRGAIIASWGNPNCRRGVYARRDTILSPRSPAPLFNNRLSQRRGDIIRSSGNSNCRREVYDRRDTVPSPRTPSGELSPRALQAPPTPLADMGVLSRARIGLPGPGAPVLPARYMRKGTHYKSSKAIHKNSGNDLEMMEKMLEEAEKVVNGLEEQLNKPKTLFPELESVKRRMKKVHSTQVATTTELAAVTPATPTKSG